LLKFLTGLMLGLAAGAGLVLVYWWVSDQQQAEALEGWEWTERRSEAGQAPPV